MNKFNEIRRNGNEMEMREELNLILLEYTRKVSYRKKSCCYKATITVTNFNHVNTGQVAVIAVVCYI